VRYYFAVDKLKTGELKIRHCPTDKLVADYNSKPLQGYLFVKHRNTILGVAEEDFAEYKQRYVEVLKQYNLYDNEEDLFEI